VENLCQLVVSAQVGEHENGRITYGHSASSTAGPCGGRAAAGIGVAVGEFDLERQARVRREFPALEHGFLAASSTDRVKALSATQDNLQLASRTILVPGGLDEQRLDRMLGLVMDHAIDSADLYFQVSREESWALEDGIVKEGSASIEEGVGVRAISGEKTGFAYSDEIQPAALEEASRRARHCEAVSRQGRAGLASQRDFDALQPVDPLASMDDAEKVAWLERVDRETRAMDPRSSR